MENGVDEEVYSSKTFAVKLIDVTVRLDNKDILKSINLSIRQGGIFALLGPSGCGKTSLMRVLVGCLHPIECHDKKRGKVSILGTSCQASNKHIGFMPQDTALHLTNTINEELFFYGRLSNMSSSKIRQRCEFVTDLLELPNKFKSISKLSGGQQRRVSFAIALLHEPKLLILDEPTVGVDPILRRKIWQHITEITQEGYVTVVLTTHYIEEARQADTISFMRHGLLLRTGKPSELLAQYQKETLEGVFLELCEDSNGSQIKRHERPMTFIQKLTNSVRNVVTCSSSPFNLSTSIGKCLCRRTISSCKRHSFIRSFYALLIKDMLKFQRNPFMLFIQFIVPVLQIILFCLCIGRQLTNVQIGFISREPIRSSSISGLIFDRIDKNILNLIEYKSISDTSNLFDTGYLSAIIDIGANFTREILDKFNHCSRSETNKYNDSQITLYVDQTNRQMIYTIAEEFIRVFKTIDTDYHLELFESTSNKSLFQLGQLEQDRSKIEYTFTYFMVPGIVLSVIFFFNVALTALSLVAEQNDGTQERVWITGVTSNEIIFSQLTIHSFVLIIQIVIVLFTSIYIIEIPMKGSLFYTAFICLAQGFCGMTFGLVISTIFKSEINAHQVTMATFYPVLLLSGIVWPIEGQPIVMRHITQWLPMTKAIDAMRGILLKGWSIEHIIVQQGFMVTFLWSITFLLLTFIIFNCRR